MYVKNIKDKYNAVTFYLHSVTPPGNGNATGIKRSQLQHNSRQTNKLILKLLTKSKGPIV